jgi:hypothetical protein
MIKLEPIQKFFSHLSKREQAVFYITIIFVSLMLIDKLIVGPIFSKIDTLNRQIGEKESAIRRNVHILSQKDRISAEISKYGNFLKAPKTEQEDMTVLLKEIESLADKSSVYLVDMKPSGVKEEGSSKRYSISLSCEAQMEQIVNFIYSVENSSSLFMIEKYQISPKSKETSVAKCSITISKIIVR